MHLIKSTFVDLKIMKRPKILAFTILESIFVIIALVVISFVLAGLYLKNSELSSNPKLMENTGETR